MEERIAMNESRSTNKKWFSFIPRSGPGIVTLIVMLIMAFSLGALITGNGKDASENTAAGEMQGADGENSATLWTCSMHPQIRLPGPGKCPICFMDLIPLKTDSGVQLGPRQLKMSDEVIKLAQIQTTSVLRGDASTEIRLTGKISYDETKLAKITAWVPGRLERLYVDYTGQRVQKGDPLVDIYSPRLVSAQEEFIQSARTLKKINDTASVLYVTAGETLEASRNKLKLYGLNDEQIAGIEESGGISDTVTIYSPTSGVVVGLEARQGMYVETGAVLYRIADLTTVWAIFDAYESDLPMLQTGQAMTFTSTAFPGERFKGKIDFIDPVLDDKSRSVKVRASIDNRKGLLKPDILVSGAVQSTVLADKNNLLIPATAPLITGTRAIVYVQLTGEREPVFEGREIELGPKVGNYYVVKSGLNEGEMVVTNGAFKIDSELQLQAKASMMNPAGGTPVPKHNHGQSGPMNMSAQTPMHIDAIDELTPLYNSYFDVQMALAADDLAKATAAYRKLVDITSNIDMSLFKGESHTQWMDYSKDIVAYGNRGAQAADLTASRDAFYYVSKVMIKMQQTLGHGDARDYYLTFCPMARDNSGAFWLQTVDTVYNSFYGASMLRCGEIRDHYSAVK